MNRNLQRKTIAITGASSGIGRALAFEFKARGATLALCDVDPESLQTTANELGADYTVVDVANREAVHKWADDVMARLGHVDAIVNNAGVTVANTFADMTYEDLDWILGINLGGVIHGTKAFLPHLLERNRGWIVNISSIFGIVAYENQAAYNITKFAVRGLNEALQQELRGTHIDVLSVHPGGIQTNIVRNARYYRDATGIGDHKALIDEFARTARTSAEAAAKQIADAMEAGQSRLLIGTDAKFIEGVQRLFPRRYPAVLRAVVQLMRRVPG